MLFYFSILLLLQKFGGGHCAVTLLQPPVIAAVSGSSVNLSCLMQKDGEKLYRVNLYWMIPEGNNKVKEFLHPRPKRGSARSDNSRLVYPVFENDLSLTIHDVQLSYTDIYICETSLLIETKNLKSTGDGTYLLVYEEFDAYKNSSDLICKVKVQSPQSVNLLWEFQGEEYDKITSSLIPTSDNSYWVISVMNSWTERCQTQQNMTVTCTLQYTGHRLVERSMEVTCAGGLQALHSLPHPILLYILIFGNSILILFVVIIIFFWVKKKKKKKRGAQVTAQHATFSATSKIKYYG